MLRWNDAVLSPLIATRTRRLRSRRRSQRGDYLVNTIMTCGNCHTPKGPRGRRRQGAFRRHYASTSRRSMSPASNITPDQETGIGNWSDAEIKAAIHDGHAAGRRAASPRSCRSASTGILPTAMLDALVAYLQEPVRR